MSANFGGDCARFALKNYKHRPHQFWLTPCLFVQYYSFIAEAVSCPSIAPVQHKAFLLLYVPFLDEAECVLIVERLDAVCRGWDFHAIRGLKIK